MIQSLPRSVQDAIGDFQRHVVREYRRRSPQWSLAQRLVQIIAKRFVETIRIKGPVVDPQIVADLLNVRLTFSKASNGLACGSITSVDRGFEAVVFGDPEESRTRFTIAHECGHVFFYSQTSGRPERIIPLSLGTKSPIARKEEGLCDDFARALLLPESLLGDVKNCDGELKDVFFLARRHKVSPETLLRRVLYDMAWWTSSVFYSIRQNETNLDVRIYRGADRRRRSDPAPIAKILSRSLEGKSFSEIVRTSNDLLQGHCGTTRPDIQIRARTFWVRI